MTGTLILRQAVLSEGPVQLADALYPHLSILGFNGLVQH
jgi:hypothetical protein